MKQWSTGEKMIVNNFRIVSGLGALLLGLVFITNLSAQITESFTEPVAIRKLAVSQPQLITQVNVEEGTFVSKGDLLAELNSDALRKRLEIAKARAESAVEVEAAEAKVESLNSRYQSILEIRQKGFSTLEEMRNAKLDLTRAEAELELARYKQKENHLQVALIESELRKQEIHSPIDGVVTMIFAREGEVVGSNQYPFATVADISSLKVRYFLDSDMLKRLRPGSRVQLEMTSSGQKVEGSIGYISPVTLADAGTTRVDVIIENREFKLRSGVPCRWLGHSTSNLTARRQHGSSLSSSTFQTKTMLTRE
ncbi:MAG: efflux RND transporter periplasmic adaptor subunit [Planctomycetota bacterium]